MQCPRHVSFILEEENERASSKKVSSTFINDPCMPTLSGICRRGVPPTAVRLFCERTAISKSDHFNISVGIMEDSTREVLDDVSRRAFAILEPLKVVTIHNWDNKLETLDVPRHPKREDLGDRAVPFGRSM